MDVHSNFPYKAAQRRIRINQMFDYFQGWKVKRLQQMALPEAQRNLPKWDPPKPSLSTALLNALAAGDEVFSQEHYQTGMRRAFVQRCQWHDFGLWLQYSANRMGKLKAANDDTSKAGSNSPIGLADVAVPLELEKASGADGADDNGAVSDSDSGSEEEQDP